MAKGKVLQAIVDVAGNIDPSLGKTIDAVASELEKINVGALATAAAIGGIAIATFNMAMDAGEYLLDLGTQFDASADTIRIGTGATGDALDGLLEDFDAIYSSIPASMEQVAQGVADFNTRLGLTGPVLQELSQQAIQVSDMLGDDLGGVIEESSQAFQQWNVEAENMGDTMDYVFRVSQDTGLGFTDLMTRAQQYGPQLQELGYSFEEATALIGQMDKVGVNADEVLAAMKKSVGTLAKEGLSASEGMALYVEQIRNAESAAEAAAIANDIFGARAGSTMAAAIRNGTLSIDDLTSSLLESQETIAGAAEDTYDFGERLQVMRQKLEVALKPLANTIFDGINAFMPTLTALMDQLTPILNDAVAAAMPFVDEFLSGAADLLEDLLPLIADLATGLLPVLTRLASSLLPPILKLAKSLLPPLLQIMEAILPPMAGLLMSILPMLSEMGAAILPVLAEVITALLPALAPLLSVLLSVLNDAIIPILPMLGQLIEMVLPVIAELIQALIPVLAPLFDLALQILEQVVMPLLPVLMDLVDALLPPMLSLLDSILPLLGPILSGLSPIADILGVIVGWIAQVVEWVAGGLAWVVDLFTGGASVEVSETVAAYAAGGFTNGLSVAGEDPKWPVEAVISFNPAYRDQNLVYWAEAGRRLGVQDATAVEQASAVYFQSFLEQTSNIWNIFNRMTEYAGAIPEANALPDMSLLDLSALDVFAGGGFTDGLSLAGEDPGWPVEAVISFNPTYRNQNLAYWAEAGRRLGVSYEDGSDLSGGSYSTTVVYELGGISFSPVIHASRAGREQNIIQQLKQYEPELADMLLDILRREEAGRYTRG